MGEESWEDVVRVSEGVRTRPAVLRKATFLYLSNGDACLDLFDSLKWV